MSSRTSPGEEDPDDLLGVIERAALGLSMILMSVLVMGNVVSRNVFGASWAFTEELGGILLIVITFGGLGYAVRHRRHIAMSALHDMLPPRGRAALECVIASTSAVVLLLMAYIALRYVLQISASGDTSNVLGIPMSVPLSIIPLGFLLAALRYISWAFSLRSQVRPPGSRAERGGTGAAGEE